MSRRALGILGVVLVVLGLAGIVGGAAIDGAGANWAGAGWGYPGMGPGMMGWGPPAGVTGQSLAPDQASALGSAVPSGATVDRTANTVTFSTSTVNLTVLASPPDGPDETFRVAGLTNPTITVPRGARVTLQLVNADAGMVHNWLLTSAQPPFPYMAMMAAPVVLGAFAQTLPPASASRLPAATISFDASTPGRYTYLCSVPGHAQEGMYGTFVVTAS